MKMNEIIKSLKQQIKELEKLIELKNKRLAELERQQFVPIQHPISVPGVLTNPALCIHEYHNPWLATIPPACKKCGQLAPYVVTYANFQVEGNV